MKLYSFWTPSHATLMHDWFLGTLHEDFDLDIHCFDSPGQGRYKEEDWSSAVLHKAELVIRAIKENPGKPFVYADCDIQFFGPVKDEILKHLQNHDIVCQRNDLQGTLCTGFWAAYGSDKLLRLWEKVRDDISQEGRDQPAFNRLIRNTSGLRYNYLPDSFFNYGIMVPGTGQKWTPGQSIKIPRQLLLHHANWTLGIDHKLQQMEIARQQFNRRNWIRRFFDKTSDHLKALTPIPSGISGNHPAATAPFDHSSEALFLHCPSPLSDKPGPVLRAWLSVQDELLNQYAPDTRFHFPDEVAVTLCNNRSEKSLLEKCYDHLGITDYKVLGKEITKWPGSIGKIIPLLRYLESGNCQKPYIFFSDADDVLLVNNPDQLMARFRREGCSILFANTHHDHPAHRIYRSFEKIRYKNYPGIHKHLNSGGFIAETAFLIECLREIENGWKNRNPWYFITRAGRRIFNDQLAWRKLHKKYYPRIKIDVTSRIFLRFDEHRHAIR